MVISTLNVILFLVASAGLVYVSRASLRVPRSHGFYRFFAWEFILVLILLNLERWFSHPFSINQVISWYLLIVSVFLVVHGVRLLRITGRPDETSVGDVPMIGIEKTTALVTVGAFKYIRHPLYSSLLFLTWGVFFKGPSWMAGILALTATLFLLATAKVEEAENARFFGAAYERYMKQTKRFIPFLF